MTPLAWWIFGVGVVVSLVVVLWPTSQRFDKSPPPGVRTRTPPSRNQRKRRRRRR